MANDHEQLNSELNNINKELESLLAKQAESVNLQKKYEEDFKKQHKINDINDLDKLIVDATGNNDDISDLLGEMEPSASSDNEINYIKIREEYNQKIEEFKNQQTEIATKVLDAQKRHLALQQQIDELNKAPALQDNEVEKNNAMNVDRIEMSSSSPIKARVSTNQIQAAHDCLGKGFILDTDQDSIFFRNTTASHPTGFKITDEKMIAVNKQPLDAHACEKMLLAGKELYGNKLVVYAPTEIEKKHMEEAAKKLSIECTVTTSKEEHQRLMDEHAKKMEVPKNETKAVPQNQSVVNNAESVNAKKADTPQQNAKNPPEVIETSQKTKNFEDTEDETPSFQSRL